MSRVVEASTSSTKFTSNSTGHFKEVATSKHITMVHPMSLNSDSCARCIQQIYPLELMGQIMGLRYHKQCFKCFVCDRNLDFKNYQTNVIDLTDRQIYCSSHAPKAGKATIDFQATDNIPRNILIEYEPERKSSLASTASQTRKSLDAHAAEIVKNVCEQSVGSFGNVAEESDDDEAVKISQGVAVNQKCVIASFF